MSLLMAGGARNQMIFKVASNPYHSVILWFYVQTLLVSTEILWRKNRSPLQFIFTFLLQQRGSKVWTRKRFTVLWTVVDKRTTRLWHSCTWHTIGEQPQSSTFPPSTWMLQAAGCRVLKCWSSGRGFFVCLASH